MTRTVAPARTASVDSDSAPAAKQDAAPESAETQSSQSEAVQPASTETASVQSETAQPVSDQPEIAPKEEARDTEQVKPEEAVRVQEEPSVARAAPEEAAEAVPDATPPAPAVTPPSFDVVRVSPSGRAVIAGRAEPGAEVTVLDDGIPLGSVHADKRGEWVLVPEKSLGGGDRELSLVHELPNGDRMQSKQVVVLSVPVPRHKPVTTVAVAEAETPVDETPTPVTKATTSVAEAATLAAEAADTTQPAAPESPATQPESASAPPVAEKAKEGVIAILVEREGDGPSRILQSPEVGGEGIGDEAQVSIRSVDYDAEGDVTLAGRTEPNAVVNVYVDDEYVGSTRASVRRRLATQPRGRSFARPAPLAHRQGR